MYDRARRARWHCALGPGSVALQISSERTDTGTSLKTEIRVLGFANAYGTPYAILLALFLAPVWLAAQPSAQISLARDRRALCALKLIDAAHDVRGVHVNLAAGPAGVLIDDGSHARAGSWGCGAG
jgi:phosphatidylinositol glycan class O